METCLKHLCSILLANSPLCVNLRAWRGLSIPNLALMRKARLAVYRILLQRRCFLAEDHLAGQVLKRGIHCQRQTKLVGEEVLGGNLHA